MTYKIEKNIPIPKDAGKTGRRSKYPFLDMEVGDSFVGSHKARYAMAFWNRSHPETKFASRTVGENQFRIWRIK